MSSYRYVYGPVSSWRLGRSLGVDPLSMPEKVCSFDCVYCQIGRTDVQVTKRRTFVTPLQIVGELRRLPPVELDYVTFSGRGEPTLAGNLGGLIRAVKKLRCEKVAVITNSSLMGDPAVREDLGAADLVVAKLDACTEEMLERVNGPAPGVTLDRIVRGLQAFRASRPGSLALQVMLYPGNLDGAREIARIARELAPLEVQLNTPLRPCQVEPLGPGELAEARRLFSGKVRTVYGADVQPVLSVSGTDTLARRGKPAH